MTQCLVPLLPGLVIGTEGSWSRLGRTPSPRPCGRATGRAPPVTLERRREPSEADKPRVTHADSGLTLRIAAAGRTIRCGLRRCLFQPKPEPRKPHRSASAERGRCGMGGSAPAGYDPSDLGPATSLAGLRPGLRAA